MKADAEGASKWETFRSVSGGVDNKRYLAGPFGSHRPCSKDTNRHIATRESNRRLGKG
jgi:hypothetical protein